MQITRSPYFRLMRLHQPTGIWLLLLPCGWALALAGEGDNLPLLLAFLAGATVMRAAGCIVNDLWDRDFDRQVERTRSRPLASGEVSVAQALTLLALLLLTALGIAGYLGPEVVRWAAAALPLVIAYPLMKRITYWPQAFLGLTFNWGALLGTVAVRGAPDMASLWLYAGGFFWTLHYDTVYAHQDKRDDRAAGVKSTALALGDRSKPVLAGFCLAALACFAIGGFLHEKGFGFYTLLSTAGCHLAWQIRAVRLDDPASCLRVFKANQLTGLLIFLAFLV